MLYDKIEKTNYITGYVRFRSHVHVKVKHEHSFSGCYFCRVFSSHIRSVSSMKTRISQLISSLVAI